MKCPFCGIEMKEIVQPGYAPLNKPDIVLYDHPANHCKHGVTSITTHGITRFIGHTYTRETWEQLFKDYE